MQDKNYKGCSNIPMRARTVCGRCRRVGSESREGRQTDGGRVPWVAAASTDALVQHVDQYSRSFEPPLSCAHQPVALLMLNGNKLA
jgi:hypothetical protein